jgi:hypothetical protein
LGFAFAGPSAGVLSLGLMAGALAIGLRSRLTSGRRLGALGSYSSRMSSWQGIWGTQVYIETVKDDGRVIRRHESASGVGLLECRSTRPHRWSQKLG